MEKNRATIRKKASVVVTAMTMTAPTPNRLLFLFWQLCACVSFQQFWRTLFVMVLRFGSSLQAINRERHFHWELSWPFTLLRHERNTEMNPLMEQLQSGRSNLCVFCSSSPKENTILLRIFHYISKCLTCGRVMVGCSLVHCLTTMIMCNRRNERILSCSMAMIKMAKKFIAKQ